MGSRLGVNVDGWGQCAPAELAASGAGWARFALRAKADLTGWLGELEALGLWALPVLDRLSVDAIGDQREAIAAYVARYPALRWWQIGNEPDQEGEASWTLSHEELNGLLGVARSVLGADRKIVGPGLASGQPDWAAGIDRSLVDVLACHPYAKEPGSDALYWLLRSYAAYRRPVWCTEYDARTVGMAGSLMGSPWVERAAAFCWTDRMVEGMGLCESPADLDDFSAAARSPHAWEESMPTNKAPGFVLGFLAKSQELGRAVVGDPLEDEHDAQRGGHDIRHQLTTTGELVYWKGFNRVDFYRAPAAQ